MEVVVIDSAQISDDIESVSISIGIKRVSVIEDGHYLNSVYKESKKLKSPPFLMT